MNLTSIEEVFNEEYRFEDLKKKAITNIENMLSDYENNFLIDSIDQLPKDIMFKELRIEYRTTYIVLNKENGAKPSFRLVFDLIEPKNHKELFTYEIEYNSNGEYSDDFFLDY